MKIKILCPLWGLENDDLKMSLDRIREAGYDGIDTGIPDDLQRRKQLLDYIEKQEWALVAQQHQAYGNSFEDFKNSFLHYLQISAEAHPLLINSHTGRDYFSYEQNLELIDLAQNFSEKQEIKVIHETHRGRFGYSPSVMNEYFKVRPGLKITADLSHWVCVTESFLNGFKKELNEAIKRTVHVHARIGYEEGPQVPDPRAPEWKYAVDHFLTWWDKIVEIRAEQGDRVLTITTEFGPPPYLQTVPYTNKPVADQFEINCYMKELLAERYSSYRR